MPNKIQCVVVGDIALDIRRSGTSTRTSPEDPSCKVLCDLTTTYELGMAGNVAAWLAAQDECVVTLCGLVVGDEAGGKVVNLCHKQGIIPCFPRIWEKNYRNKDRVTTVKERICHIEGERIHQLVRCDRDMAYEINSEEAARILEQVERADLVVVADYGKGVFAGECGARLREWIGQSNPCKTVVVNSKFPNNWEGLNISALICNEKEAIDALIERGSRQMKTSNYIVTEGARGVSLYRTSGHQTFRSHCNCPVDVTGAGDSFLAGFALIYHRLGQEYKDESIGHAIETGQHWAASSCSKIGCGAPTCA